MRLSNNLLYSIIKNYLIVSSGLRRALQKSSVLPIITHHKDLVNKIGVLVGVGDFIPWGGGGGGSLSSSPSVDRPAPASWAWIRGSGVECTKNI